MSQDNQTLQQRREKAEALADLGVKLYDNSFRPTSLVENILPAGEHLVAEEHDPAATDYAIAGRVMSMRKFGKAAFCHLADRSGQIQIYLKKETLGETEFEKSKSMRPLPEKWHGLSDVETRYRQRYVDLIVTPESRATFRKRVEIIRLVREYLNKLGYMEVETPMMQAVPGGATAKPFKTHHNALSMDLFLRIAPELYLKRLLVGGFERVFEINRNFRNEGLSTRHNPEFTMLEFYQAYATYDELMDLTEDMISSICATVNGTMQIEYQGTQVNLASPWKRLTMDQALVEIAGIEPALLNDDQAVLTLARQHGIKLEPQAGPGKAKTELFELLVEDKLIDPTFITSYPTEVSPLARRNESDPEVTDRFELFITGREIANGFSELNDPVDQRERFEKPSRGRLRLHPGA
jgi:lysyl-tRNA synthetase, class II